MAKTVSELSGYCDTLTRRLDAAQQDVVDLWAESERLSERLHEADVEIAKLRETTTYLREQFEKARDLARNEERAGADLRTEFRSEVAVLRQRADDTQRLAEEWGRRAWTLIPVFLSALLALASGLIVALVRK